MGLLNPLLLLASVLLAGGAVLAAHRLQRLHRHRFLGDYAVHLGFAAAWGFVLWTLPGILESLGLHLPSHHERLKWYAFPFHLLQLGFLLAALQGMLGSPLSRRQALAAAGIALATLLGVFGGILHRSLTGSSGLEGAISARVTDLYLLAQALLWLAAAWRARRLPDPAWGSTVTGFAAAGLAAFSLQVLLTTFWVRSDGLCALLFAACPWPGLLLLARGLARVPAGQGPPGLTARERDLLERVLAGQSNQEIAAGLFLSPQTVKNSLSRLYRKLGVAGRLELLRVAPDGFREPPGGLS